MTTPQMRNVFQIAYVTNDLERAAGVLRDQYGCGDAHYMRNLPGALTDIALCFAGNTNYEMLEPLNASGDFYSDWIAGETDFVMRFHHLGMIVETKEELDAIQAAHVRHGHEFPLVSSMPGVLDVFYADTRASLGHYLEYFHLQEAGWDMFKAVPGCPF